MITRNHREPKENPFGIHWGSMTGPLGSLKGMHMESLGNPQGSHKEAIIRGSRRIHKESVRNEESIIQHADNPLGVQKDFIRTPSGSCT